MKNDEMMDDDDDEMMDDEDLEKNDGRMMTWTI
jgi:hypothetical protein